MRQSERLVTFTVPAIRAVKAKQEKHTEYRVKDNRGNVLQGLVLHAHPSGRKIWKVHYYSKADGKRVSRKPKIGTNQTPLELVRQRWREIADALDDGLDPVAEQEEAKRTAERERAEKYTFADLASDFMRLHSKPKKRTWRSDQRQLERDILPCLGDIHADQVTKRDVIRCIDLKTEAGARAQADRNKALISSIYGWGEDEALVEINPARRIRRRAESRRRERVLTDDEIVRLWLALEDDDLRPGQIKARNAIRLGLLTAQRRAEISGARKDELELDVDIPLWRIPSSRSKNKLPHEVPLSRWACKVFREAVAASTDEPFVFPGRHHGKSMSKDSVSHEMQAIRQELGWGDDVDFHVIRHTVNTGMAKLQVPKHVRSLILSHVSNTSDITDRYDHHLYHTEMLEALERWAQHLNEIITGGERENVRSL